MHFSTRYHPAKITQANGHRRYLYRSPAATHAFERLSDDEYHYVIMPDAAPDIDHGTYSHDEVAELLQSWEDGPD